MTKSDAVQLSYDEECDYTLDGFWAALSELAGVSSDRLSAARQRAVALEVKHAAWRSDEPTARNLRYSGADPRAVRVRSQLVRSHRARAPRAPLRAQDDARSGRGALPVSLFSSGARASVAASRTLPGKSALGRRTGSLASVRVAAIAGRTLPPEGQHGLCRRSAQAGIRMELEQE